MTMAYTGDVTPGGPSDVRELGSATLRKMSVSDMHNNVYLLTCTATGEQLMVDAADDPDRCLALVAEGTGRDLAPEVTGGFRVGDVRHVVASPELATRELGFTATVSPDDGLPAFATAPLRA